jgi:2-polyprenyl-3-methyl-5-hydroxy-6-metoxy-1,4-benzoquinol methylase
MRDDGSKASLSAAVMCLALYSHRYCGGDRGVLLGTGFARRSIRPEHSIVGSIGGTKMIRQFINWNRGASERVRTAVARLVPGCRADGQLDFRDRVLPGLLRPGMRVLDVGGGKFPGIPLATKQSLGLHVTGLDISASELKQAPPGAYDGIVVGDVATVELAGSYDLIFSRAVLEHVSDPVRALANLASVLAPGGVMAHAVPCRNASFAVLNRWLGNRLGRQLLFAVFPEKRKNSGFPAFYRDCTPSGLSRACQRLGLEVEILPYYRSDYTSFFVPAYVVFTLMQASVCALGLEDLSEVFAILARRPDIGSEDSIAERIGEAELI